MILFVFAGFLFMHVANETFLRFLQYFFTGVVDQSHNSGTCAPEDYREINREKGLTVCVI